MFKRLVLALAAVCIMLPSTVLASGFAINEQGAKALGMGGAFVAQADDATAVYYNPAGITQLEGTQLSVGMSLIRPATSFKADNGRDSETKDQTFAIPTLYIASKINDKISVGFGAFVNFGLGMDWKDNWDGAHLPGGANAEIQTVSANPTVAFAVTKDFSVAAGLVYQTLDVTIESITPALNQVVVSQPLKLEGDSDAISWNIAAHYKLGNNLRFGISYRPEVKHEVEGRGKTASLIPGLAGKFKADLTLPAVTQLGVAWTNNKWTVELDGQYTEWSSYDELNPKGLPAIGVREKNWDDVWAIRLGTQYQFNEKLALRAGIVRDYSPVPSETIDPMLPTGDRWLYTVGFGYKFNESLTLDFAYNYLDDESRRFDNKSGDIFYGTQGSPRVTGKFEDPDAHIFAMSVNYKF